MQIYAKLFYTDNNGKNQEYTPSMFFNGTGLPTSLGQKTMSASTSVTLASDQSALPTDVRASASAQAVTPSDSTNLTGTSRALYVGTGGNVVAIIGGTAVTFTNVQDGSILPIACTRVNATNTTASNMVALY